MLFKHILGLEHIKSHLVTTAETGRVAHAQLFVGPEGSGVLPMAIAYAQYLLCGNTGGENEGENTVCNTKCNSLTHPDLHFAFPVSNSDKVKSHAVSDHYLEEWRMFVSEQPYGNLFDWYRLIGIEKKQGQIGVDEAQDMVKKLSLKSYEGGYKVLIVWMAEKMNVSAANKLLKLIEEPPNKTVLLLLAEDEEQIINTIRSRCQILNFPPLAEQVITDELLARGVAQTEALTIALEANGNFNKALDLLNKDSEDLVFERWFVQWVRSAFKAKGNKGAIQELILWSDEVSKTGREVQKKFLNYCLTMMRQALLLNYKAKELVYTKVHMEGFDLNKFAPFVHENNILDIVKELEEAIFHVERNGNSKLIFTDLSIKLTRLLHAKAA
ncbi:MULTISPECIES: ATP-binding protein [Flavobacteriaceae]|jgi:DNA polymerase-3 subunit delta'|uniref:DNA polymerase III subunit delta n=1 Tax=Flagellimonas sp. MMG031 TaxID=3158549 RepID=A0AAU7N2I8_9FLAO|nr:MULTISPECIES: DNA polymerase III subunit delta' [unclassified Allomuricauda]MBO6532561.1 DNA polymerase III subunit delta' [Allomuricauda sp.]MBO6588002.1 DNA polymerase III subunit delta' [Allomuricauda sp.]MBO6617627.1 DNA polymerase III subunit delta' [Allomuricauda sp.]MBO6643362.1 DNA polymerase III subunit delta' [Allomuricauda sp.]MBO6745962.1 DNA polymerase III subunit delta' [Allomuricauda sp.]